MERGFLVLMDAEVNVNREKSVLINKLKRNEIKVRFDNTQLMIIDHVHGYIFNPKTYADLFNYSHRMIHPIIGRVYKNTKTDKYEFIDTCNVWDVSKIFEHMTDIPFFSTEFDKSDISSLISYAPNEFICDFVFYFDKYVGPYINTDTTKILSEIILSIIQHGNISVFSRIFKFDGTKLNLDLYTKPDVDTAVPLYIMINYATYSGSYNILSMLLDSGWERLKLDGYASLFSIMIDQIYHNKECDPYFNYDIIKYICETYINHNIHAPISIPIMYYLIKVYGFNQGTAIIKEIKCN